MLAAILIFEVEQSEQGKAAYLQAAAAMRKHVEGIDGFVSVERFESMAEPGRILALSFWRDEAALEAWRNLAAHRGAQTAARAGLFRDYRIRIARVIREYGPSDRDQAPSDSRAAHG